MVQFFNLLNVASNLSLAQDIGSLASSSVDALTFISYNSRFTTDILGANVSQRLVAMSMDASPFHEAGVYNIATGSLYATSNLNATNTENRINVTRIAISRHDAVTELRFPNISMANGATAYYPPGTPMNSSANQQIAFCDQGNMTSPAQIVLVQPSTNQTRVLADNFFGRNFTSPNDIKQHAVTSDLWFTDPPYGFWQGFRPSRNLPAQVYRLEPDTGVIQVVADSFVAPNGIEFCPEFDCLYVSDSGSSTYPNSHNNTGPATIYKYDITSDGKAAINRRPFAFATEGIPDGIHTDTNGNVYSGTGRGIEVWDPSGAPLGVIGVGNGGIANFAFVPDGMYLFNEARLFHLTMQARGREVQRDFGLSR